MMITIFNSKKVIKILLVLGMVFQLSSCKTETCDDNCRLLQNTVLFASIGGFNNLEQCPYDYNLSPGDSVSFNTQGGVYSDSITIIGCSSSAWTLTATPTTGVTARIVRNTRPYCANGTLLQSSAVGTAVSIAGLAGCITSGADVIQIKGSDAVGSVTVTYN